MALEEEEEKEKEKEKEEKEAFRQLAMRKSGARSITRFLAQMTRGNGRVFPTKMSLWANMNKQNPANRNKQTPGRRRDGRGGLKKRQGAAALAA